MNDVVNHALIPPIGPLSHPSPHSKICMASPGNLLWTKQASSPLLWLECWLLSIECAEVIKNLRFQYIATLQKLNRSIPRLFNCVSNSKTWLTDWQGETLLQKLHFVSPEVMMSILHIYAAVFYGRSLWNLYFPEVVRIFSTWNVTGRNILGLSLTTRSYLIEGVSGNSHPKTMIYSRFLKFLEGVSTSLNLNP